MSIIKRSDKEIETLESQARAALLAREPSFTERTYHQGIMDALQYLYGEEENPYEAGE